MTKQELENRLESALKQLEGLKDEVDNLKAKLAEQDKQDIPDSPTFEESGGSMWFMNLDLKKTHCNTEYASAGDFNSFHTREYAEEFRRKCLMIAMMLHCKWYLDREHVPDWNNKAEEKWQVFWSNLYKRYEVCDWSTDEYGSVYFSTEEAAQKCADWLNAHWKESTEVGDTDEV